MVVRRKYLKTMKTPTVKAENEFKLSQIYLTPPYKNLNLVLAHMCILDSQVWTPKLFFFYTNSMKEEIFNTDLIYA